MIVRAIGMVTWWELVLAMLAAVAFVAWAITALEARREGDRAAWLRMPGATR